MAFLAREGLRYTSIKSYLSGLRFFQIHQNLGNPFGSDLPRLSYVLTGIKRTQAHAGVKPKPRLPITFDIMALLHKQWHTLRDPDVTVLWAAACIGFFGWLRIGEFTVPSMEAYDPDVHLNLADVAVDNHTEPSVIGLRIKQSKTDPFREGVTIYLGATGKDICPVKALLAYIAIRPPDPGPLLLTQSGQPLSRQMLVSRLQKAVANAGLNSDHFNGHSFRIGAATSAAKNGIEDSLIQTMGRWKSSAYKLYIKLPKDQLACVSKVLAS